MYKLSTFLFVLFFFSSLGLAQSNIFSDNFDSYTAGQQLACQNPTDWTTWSNAPCGSEDGYVSDDFSFSGLNSAKIVTNNDQVKDFGTAYTSGKYKISFQVYIPAGKAGYFNTLALFAGGTSNWGMECYFDLGGAGRVLGGSATPVAFTWPVVTWFLVENIVDLDADQAQMIINGTLVHTWQWSLASGGTGGPLSLDANDFFGATPDDEMYFDDYELTDMLAPPPGFSDNFDSYIADQQLCTQTTEWQTWSGTPGTAEDPFISTTYAWSSANSVKIVQNNDLVRLHGSKTSGKWYMSFIFYIPAAKSGYFNAMNGFAPNPNVWGMDAYFDAGGAGRVDTTGGGGVPANTVNFTWAVAQWNQVIVVVDLDTHVAEFWVGTTDPLTFVATWDWTQGGTKPTRLDCNDIFGAAATDEMYVDNYYFGSEMPVVVPVELSAFSANVNNGNVVLNWTTETELNNQGFEIERRSSEGQFVTIGQVQGNGTTTERQQYSFTDAGVLEGSYYYRLKQVDFNGSYEYSNEIFVDVTVVAPLDFALNQNYPNPFNPTTNINFSLAEPTFVKLAVYNLLGEVVRELKNETMNAGSYDVSFDAASLPSGMYLYKIETAQFTSVRKMMLMK